MMSLLDLPAEIVQHVLYRLDPESFYLCLLTSKLMRQHALQSKKLLRHQLDQVPGTRKLSRWIRDDASALLLEFSKRATKHLFNGASHMVNIHTWKAPQTMNRSLSQIVSWYDICKGGGCLTANKSTDPRKRWLRLLLETHASTSVINIRSLEGTHGNDENPKLLYVISPTFLSTCVPEAHNDDINTYQIIRIAWAGACPIGTCSSDPLLAILLRTTGQPLGKLVLVVIILDPYVGPRVTAKYDIKAPRDTAVVTDMVITPEGDPKILWLYPRKSVYKFVGYKSLTDIAFDNRYLTADVVYKIPATMTMIDRISQMRVEGDNVLFFPSSMQIPLWKGTESMTRGWQFAREDTSLPEMHVIWLSDVLGKPIKHYHHHKLTHKDLNNSSPTCVNTALKLFINRKNYDSNQTIPLRKGAFILKAVQYPLGCTQFDPYAPHGPLEHIPVACLADPPDLDNLPTIGLKVAVSPRSHRIALAAWKTLRVYSIDPMAFLSPKHSHGSPKTHSRWHSHDFAFVYRCGREYYSNGASERGCVVLEPIDLKTTGIIYALEWRSEDQLWALTNEGVCKWDIGVWAKGRVGKSELGQGDGQGSLVSRKYPEALSPFP
ncbi:hypothetical protein BU23DRAFT_595628 [Bimuria novae-zelandiae CBS 107.79]|uniref:F-box domain-containing protein n=1 Tax=Bimuria novae-zelandiae CBS 107.79 TaxID=1447943 RepID=A0A6A5VZ74_9PLEO|nr:hypothetical protein BU23DRAFT_595628 [Bimuria novae-zelandiae CBS 107.79]